MVKMQGLSLSSIKKHTPLIPLFACIIVGASGALLYTLRLATRNPDVSWTNKRDAQPWDYYKDKQYKFLAPKIDYSKTKSPAPEY